MLLSLLALSSIVDATYWSGAKEASSPYKYYLEFQYSNKFITVGDTWLWNTIWQKGFESGNAAGISTDELYTQYGFNNMCIQDGSKPDLEVRIKMDGKWGTIDGMDGTITRNQLVQAMWEMVLKIQEDDGTVWRGCASAVYGLSDNPKALCGKFRPLQCKCRKNGGDGGYNADLCMDKVPAYRIPEEMEVNVYNIDGSLRADTLVVTVTSHQVVEPIVTCGKLGAVAEVAFGMIPEFGKSLADQIKILCRN
ncbi:hypothetical protein Tdes44962_MAKER05128 [Teratosphaeria destructans]|uniref:Uncharacterized protein n=1 Tax=Teratosphaeria destructans TaxID=418781 RepID=A0A9W7VZ20_9PEZI|nr:hypothetical protein Tdes44962_MAKER05128 [Teratosphaeria destructans]